MSATVIAHKPLSLNNSPSATSSSAAAASLHHAAELDLKRWIREAARVCRNAAAGNLESRILHVDADGDVGDMLHGINHLLDMTDAFVREAMASLEHVSQNKFYRRVLTAGMLGSFRRAAVSINDAAQLMENRTSALREAEARRATLDDEFQAAAGVVENLTTATEQIAGISELIRHVAAQSTLLALNASIESARVGEAGKGFNVVAREVKRLADETRAATKDIANNVAEIQQASQAVADVMQRVWNAVKA